MERILVIGSPGAGKSTLARIMSETLELPLVCLDALFWLPGWIQRDRTEFDRLLTEQLQSPRWIMDGDYNRTIPLRLQYCDTVIFLDFPTRVCFLGVLKRILTYRGKVRPDMGEGCPERFDGAFLRYVLRFRKVNRKNHYKLLASADASVQVVVLKSRRQVKKFLESL